MQSVGGQPDDYVAFCNRLSFDNPVFLHHPDNETDQVVVAAAVNVAKLRHFPADKCTAHIPAGLRHSFDDRLHLLRHQLTDADIVQEEDGLGAAGENVVHTVVDDVDADGIVPAQRYGKLQFGAYSVDAGYQHRMFVALELVHPPEKTDPAQYFGTHG